MDICWVGSSKFGWLYAEFPCKLHNMYNMIVCVNGFMLLGKTSVEGFPYTLLSFSVRVTDCGILLTFLFITLLKCQFQTLKIAKSKVNAAVNCYCCQMAAFPLQGEGEGLDLTGCIFFFLFFLKSALILC